MRDKGRIVLICWRRLSCGKNNKQYLPMSTISTNHLRLVSEFRAFWIFVCLHTAKNDYFFEFLGYFGLRINGMNSYI